jgi:uncharacterized phage protein gp47/JayE
MPNAIDSSGLTIQTTPEIIAEILDGAPGYPGMRQIYGADINVEANSPDGQMVNIIAQAKTDVLELSQQIYNSFDPDKAVGTSLDARCAINGVIRNAGTKTIQNVVVTTDRALTLPGLDTSLTPFTVADTSGNQYQLVSTYAFGSAASTALVFQAALIGAVSSLPNTIISIVTVTLGVTAVNNPATYTTLGLNEETDYALRIRRQKSVALPSQGYLEGLIGALLDTTDVTEAVVYENDTNTTDANGIPGHSIWCVVEGGTNSAVANAIYVKRNAGCGMKGSVTVPVLQADGSFFSIKFDRPTSENLYISFDIVAVTGSVDASFIRNQILSLLTYSIAQPAVASEITALVESIAPNGSISDMGVSNDGSTYVSLLDTSAIDNQWALASARIIINGS